MHAFGGRGFQPPLVVGPITYSRCCFAAFLNHGKIRTFEEVVIRSAYVSCRQSPLRIWHDLIVIRPGKVTCCLRQYYLERALVRRRMKYFLEIRLRYWQCSILTSKSMIMIGNYGMTRRKYEG